MIRDIRRYADMLHLPHHISPVRPPMKQADRAAQFSPFAALTGHEAAIAEAARLTEEETEPAEDQAELLDRALRQLTAMESPEVTAVWFCPDPHKPGGAYRTTKGNLLGIDTARNLLLLSHAPPIPLQNLRSLDSPLLR